MKPLLVFFIVACALVSTSAQNSKMNLVIEKKEKKTVVTQEQGKNGQSLEIKKRLEFDHFFANLAKTNNAIKVFDLTQPIDEKKAKEQVTEQAPTSRLGRRPTGIKLFSIRF